MQICKGYHNTCANISRFRSTKGPISEYRREMGFVIKGGLQARAAVVIFKKVTSYIQQVGWGA